MDAKAFHELIRQSVAVPPTVHAREWTPEPAPSVEPPQTGHGRERVPEPPPSVEPQQAEHEATSHPVGSSPGARDAGSSPEGSARRPSGVTVPLLKVSFEDLLSPPFQGASARPDGAAADAGAEEPPAVESPGRATDTPAASPAERLRGALVDLGVQGPVVETLISTAQACADVAVASSRWGRAGAGLPGVASDDEAEQHETEQHEAEQRTVGRHEVGGPDAEQHEAEHDAEHRDREATDPAAIDPAANVVEAISTLARTAGQLDSVVLTAASVLSLETGDVLLTEKGVASPDELSRRQRELWRSRAKSLTRREIAAATGWGEGEAADLVALANTPQDTLSQVHSALRSGEVTWRLARSFYRKAGALDTADAAGIAAGLFGNDPGKAVTERLDSSGAFHGHPWWHKEYYRALEREVAKVKACDPEATRKTREENAATNDVRLNLDEFGTGVLMVGTTATQGAAMIDRISKAAKAARAAGDPRTLRQLRTAVATALLLHGSVDVPGLPDDPALITPEQSAELTKVLYALPTAELNLIVPLTTLLGMTTGALTPVGHESGGNRIPAAFGGYGAPETSGFTSRAGCSCVCTCGATQGSPGTAATGEICTDPPATGTGSDAPGEIGIAEVVGTHSIFLTPEEARTLALTPGSTLFRLVTDPVTGALLERSSSAYRFDGAMRAHIIAADVFCRAPGCLKPAALAQIDHVQEHGTPGGHTCISNGQPLDSAHHDLKTKKHWDAVLHDNRDLTWTTLLGRIYTTKTHDYRQYTRLLEAATTAISTDVADGMSVEEAVDRQIYQALTYRPPGAPLATEDDSPEADEYFTGWDQVTTTHTRPNGTRSYHPEATIAQAEHDRVKGSEQPEDSDVSRGSSAADRDRSTDTGKSTDTGNSTDTDSSEAGDPGTPGPVADTPGTPTPGTDNPGTSTTGTQWTWDPDEEPPF